MDAFTHSAPFVEAESRIEMHLVCNRSHHAYVSAVEMSFQFHQGEIIHTENSHKYSLGAFSSLCHAAGLSVRRRWTDDAEWFALLLVGPETPSEA